ncbi:MAG: hypothetical protein EU530_05205 [Promethearchaeota archaeon]|nr:MAG: hypothetical protein EU530_05205 [Candidatus Lokiarchaeota archaeon]
MKESRRNVLFGVYLFLLLIILGFLAYVKIGLQPHFFTGQQQIFDIGITIAFLGMFGLMVNELYHWRKQGKRSEAFDLVLLIFIFVTIYLLTYDPELDSVADPIMNSIIGAFGIFIIFGAYELREYEVLNKLLIITAVTYNIIFIATLVNSFLHDAGIMIEFIDGEYIKNWKIRDTAFSFSIWIILILGFALFGRKYIVVLRFMSPEYLTMFLYIIAWLAVRTLSLIWKNIISPEAQRSIVYGALFVISWAVYAVSGPVLDKMLGIKRVSKQIKKIDKQLEEETNKEKIKQLENEKRQYVQLQKLVDEVSSKVKLKKLRLRRIPKQLVEIDKLLESEIDLQRRKELETEKSQYLQLQEFLDERQNKGKLKRLRLRRIPKQLVEIDKLLESEINPERRKELEIDKSQYLQLQELLDALSSTYQRRNPVKVGFGKYPILNAMAYGAFFDKRIAIISSDINEIPADELKGIIGHELHHAKGLDTLLLSVISSIQLLVFWAIPGWPATMYDYTFGTIKPPIPLWGFIVVNFAITIIIYVFIRILEGRADRRTRQSGFGNELAKGLYNLEGFYSSGREIGLDTMLLSEEKIIEYNKVDNYSTTAQYLDDHMNNPKVGSLLSNLMNSHPPSYLRILTMYDNEDQIKPGRESIMPFLLLGKGGRLKYGRNMKAAREKYREMANKKFKSMFGIENYAAYLEYLKKKEVYEVMMNKVYLHVDEETFSVGIGVMKDLKIEDEVCEPFKYIFSPIEVIFPENGAIDINAEKFIQFNTSHTSSESYIVPEDVAKLKELEFGALYQLSKKMNAILVSVKIDPLLHEEAAKLSKEPAFIKKSYNKFKKLLRKYITYYFLDEKEQLVEKKWRFKPKFNLNTIYKAKGKEIFLKERATLQLLRLKEIRPDKDKFHFTLVCENVETGEEDNYPLNSTLVIKNEFGLHFHSDSENFDDEIKILDYLKKNLTRVTIYLKKAVNNMETGYIQSITYDENNPKANSFLVLNNIHTQKIEIPLKKIETVVFSYETIGIMKKEKMSLAERFMQKVLYWTQPDQIYYP